MELHLRATVCHLPCGITHCHPTQVSTPHVNPSWTIQAGTRFTYPEVWKAELTISSVLDTIRSLVY